MSDGDRKRRRIQAALRPTGQPQQTLGLLFNIDTDGHEYPSDLLDLAADDT